MTWCDPIRSETDGRAPLRRGLPALFLALLLVGSLVPLSWAETLSTTEEALTSPIISGVPITMKEAVRRALHLRPLRKIDQDRIRNLRATETQARSTYLPQLQASYQNTYANSFLGFFLFPNYQFVDAQLTTVTLTQLIFDFGRTTSQISQRKWSLRAQKDTYLATSQSIIRDVETAYYGLIEAIEQEGVSRLNVIDARNHLDASLMRLKAGMGLKADVTQARVNLANAILGRIQAVNARKKAQIVLATTIGDMTEKHYVPVTNLPIPEGLRARLLPDLRKASEANPSLLAARHSVNAAQENLKVAWRQNYPSLTGQAQYFLAQIPPSALGFPSLPSGPYSSFAFGGVLNIPIFEGGGNLAQIHQARAFLNESIHQKEETELSVSSQVRQAYLDIAEARQELAESRTELQNALEYDRLEEGSYSAGMATALDVIDAQTALRKARADLVTAKYSLAQKVVLYHYAVGDLSPP